MSPSIQSWFVAFLQWQKRLGYNVRPGDNGRGLPFIFPKSQAANASWRLDHNYIHAVYMFPLSERKIQSLRHILNARNRMSILSWFVAFLQWQKRLGYNVRPGDNGRGLPFIFPKSQAANASWRLDHNYIHAVYMFPLSERKIQSLRHILNARNRMSSGMTLVVEYQYLVHKIG